MRKSSRRSDQRRPPRATGPPRRWMPSTRGLNRPRSRATAPARGRPGTSELLILNASASSAAGAKALVRTIASTSARRRRRMRSSSIERTLASAAVELVAQLGDLRRRASCAAGSCAATNRPISARVAFGRAAQRIDDGDQAEAAAGLAQIAEPGAQPDDRLRVEPGVQHELVELVVLGRAAQHVGDRALDLRRAREDRLEIGLGADLDAEIVDVAVAAAERGRHFLEHAEAEILEHRHRFGQRDQPAAAIGLQPQLPGRVVRRAREMRTRAVVVVGELGTGAGCRRRLPRARCGRDSRRGRLLM